MPGGSLGADDAGADPGGEGPVWLALGSVLGPENNESKPFPGLSDMDPACEDGACVPNPLIIERRPDDGGSLEGAES